jgi:EAL domain-containing protein (putative c-di-GMP-specific phosphodiesterase class I)
MDDARATMVTLEQLRGIGVYLSIDDFGTGYSSMNYLKRFDVRALKIDKSFISGLPLDSENAAITRAIIAMAHGLKMAVAEGVETDAQLACWNNTAATWCRATTSATPPRRTPSTACWPIKPYSTPSCFIAAMASGL